jgi:hypothetical protein
MVSSSNSAPSTDIGGHVSLQFTISDACYQFYCSFSAVLLCQTVHYLLPLIFSVFYFALYYLICYFPFLKMCSMSLDGLFHKSTTIFPSTLAYLHQMCYLSMTHFSPKPHLFCLQLFFSFLISCPSFTTMIGIDVSNACSICFLYPSHR